MLFNSLEFALFFPIVTILYFTIPHRFRWALLLGASCVFYMAFIPAYILILAFTIVVDYIAGIVIESSQGKLRKTMLIASLAANIGVLAIFKYYAFATGSATSLLQHLGVNVSFPAWRITLPIGLSFHTFQAMSYTIEVYRGRQKAERHFGIYALYVMFYPQLVAGPIERPQNLLHQFYEEHFFDYARVVHGLQRMAQGLFKKIAIADQLAPFANKIFENPGEYHGLSIFFAILSFAFQIYFDFSGYSDIALGSAEVMGFKLMENFDTPYFASSITEFWRRWHISLSTWFKDYLYIPLGGSRVSTPRWCTNILIVFTVSGLWHGANWTYVIWGAIHGLMIVFEGIGQHMRTEGRHSCRPALTAAGVPPLLKLQKKAEPEQPQSGWVRLFGIVRTFTLVCIAWVFFRASTFSDAWMLLARAVAGLPEDIRLLAAGRWLPELALGPTLLKIVGVPCILYLEYLHRRKSVWLRISYWPAWGRFAAYYAVIYLTLWAASNRSGGQFIYFQF
ncbi:MAG TPA: MBOAT family O-acyltransferase [Planctomycetota bacterium]|nr:MBOAT family O-acyltransferase [Planctomycetota bacterium]